MSRKTFWDSNKIKILKNSLKKNTQTLHVAQELSEKFGTQITQRAIHGILSKLGLRAVDYMQERDRTLWTDTQILRAKEVLNNSASIPIALGKLSSILGRNVTADGLRTAMYKAGHTGNLTKFLNKNTDRRRVVGAINADNLDDVVSILKRHQTLPAAIKEMKHKIDDKITYKKLATKLKEKFGAASSPSTFLNHTKLISGTNEDESVQRLINLVGKKNKSKISLSFRDLCNEFDCSPKKMESLIQDVKLCGYNISVREDNSLHLNKEIETEKIVQSVYIPGETKQQFRFGVISDTHFGSQAAMVNEARHFITQAHNEFGVKTMLHCGDILAGDQVYRGQIAELDHWGCQKQCQAAAEALPRFDDMQYWGILGNHDVSFTKNAGVDVGKILESMRPDFHCIGALSQKIKLNNVEIELAHLKSSAHARSYSLEKHIYKTASSANKVQAVFCGHRHTNGYFEVQKIHNFLVPCFEDVSMFLKYNDMTPSVGGLIVDFFLDDAGNIIRIAPQFFLYNIEQSSMISIAA